MKFTARRCDLLFEIVHLVRIASGKTSTPVLNGIYLEAKKGHVRLVATDLDTGLVTQCRADVARVGSAVAPAKKLLELVRSLPEDAEATFDLEENHWLRIVAGNVNFRLACLPAADFPTIKDTSETPGIVIPGGALSEVLARVAFAITTDDARYYLAGALLVLDGVDVAACATDGHRLAFARRSVAGAKWEPRQVLIPRVVVHELRQLLESVAPMPDVEVRIADDTISFLLEPDRILFTKPITGSFPAYQKVIDLPSSARAVVARRPLLNALRRTGILSSERSRVVKLLFQGDPYAPGAFRESLTLMTSSPDLGEAREVLQLASYEGATVEVGFNAAYLADFLNAIENDQVSIGVKDAETQGRLSPVAAGGEHDPDVGADYQYVVMPMRL